MSHREPPLLHRNDPDKAPLVGHVKVTRQDWLNAARDILVHDGVEQVKILTLSAAMGVSRSSFYWYFDNRDALLAALLDDWQTRNTHTIILHCRKNAANITHALCNFFRCFVDPDLFDRGLDFGVREWARRAPDVRRLIDAADAERLDAVELMFRQHGYEPTDADARARILYFMQLGYHALEVRETLETRLARVPAYIEGFTGQAADPDAIADFSRFARAASQAAAV